MGVTKNLLLRWSGSVTYNDPDEGVDYNDLSYKLRAEEKPGDLREETVYYLNYIRGCAKKLSGQAEYKWMETVTKEDLYSFLSLYARYYDGYAKDAWFFFRYHYLEYKNNPGRIFPQCNFAEKSARDQLYERERKERYINSIRPKESDRYNCGYCWSCKKNHLTSTRCEKCGWYICTCGACSSGCQFNRRHYGEYQEFVKNKREKQEASEEASYNRHLEYEKKRHDEQINSISGKIASGTIGLASEILGLGVATVGTAVRLVPYMVAPDSELVKKMDDAIDKSCDIVKETGKGIGIKAGRKIDELNGKEDFS